MAAENNRVIVNINYLSLDLARFSFQSFIPCYLFGNLIVSDGNGRARYTTKKIAQIAAGCAADVSCKINCMGPALVVLASFFQYLFFTASKFIANRLRDSFKR